MSLQDKIKNAKETSWPLVTPKKETITYLDGFADGLNMANNSTNKMLDKIRAEIQENINYNKKMNYQGIVAGLLLTLDIIDKYKAESEINNGNDD